MWSLSVPAGLIYGFLLFLVILVGMQILARRSAVRHTVETSPDHFAEAPHIPKAQLEELRRLRSANIIGESEYQRRVWEIEAGKQH